MRFAAVTNSVAFSTYFDISGSFTFDADTNQFSNVNLGNIVKYITMYGTSQSQYGTHATSITGTANQITFFVGVSTTLNFASALSNAGGVVDLSSGTFNGTTCCTFVSGQVTGVPQATASAVPEPEAYAMMLAGLGLVGFAARRQLS